MQESFGTVQPAGKLGEKRECREGGAEEPDI